MSKKHDHQEKGFETARIFSFRDIIDYAAGSIVSKQMIKKENGNVTLFAFDKGEELSEHTSPYDAMVQVIEGKGKITIGGREHSLEAGEGIIMPANVPHAVYAPERFKMVLTMIR